MLGACEVGGAQLELSQEEARPGAAWPGCQGLRQAAWGPHPPEWTRGHPHLPPARPLKTPQVPRGRLLWASRRLDSGGTHSSPFARVPPAQEAQAPSRPLQLLCVPGVRREGLSLPLILRASQPQRTVLQVALNTPSARATPRPGRIDSLGVGPRHPVFGGKAAQVIPGTGEEDMRWEDRAGGKEGEADRSSDVAPEANAAADRQR